MAIKGVNPYEMAQAQFDKVAAILDLDPATRELLRQPLREHSFAILTGGHYTAENLIRSVLAMED